MPSTDIEILIKFPCYAVTGNGKNSTSQPVGGDRSDESIPSPEPDRDEKIDEKNQDEKINEKNGDAKIHDIKEDIWVHYAIWLTHFENGNKFNILSRNKG